MTYQTHAYLGTVLFPAICKTWNVTLSKKRFIAGSIKPDMSSLFLRHPHFWKHSRRFVYKKIQKLARKSLMPGKKHKKFSEDLGIILHYVADFFTAVHNIKPNKLLEHLAYEDSLHAEFLQTVTMESFHESFRVFAGNIDFETLLTRQHSQYRPTRDDPSADIREIIVACITVTSYIMNGATAKIAL